MEGFPIEVGSLCIQSMHSIFSLEHISEKVHDTLYWLENGKTFSGEEILKVCKCTKLRLENRNYIIEEKY